MDLDRISAQLSRQAEAIRALVEGVPDEQARWKPSSDDWSILEVTHHLVDEEIEDFRRHLDHILIHADQPWPRIDPGGWVTERRSNEQEPAAVLAQFLAARQESLAWLATLGAADWDAAIATPWGALPAGTCSPPRPPTTCCTCGSWWSCIMPGPGSPWRPSVRNSPEIGSGVPTQTARQCAP